MQVKIFEVDENLDSPKLIKDSVPIEECFPDDPHETARAKLFLNISGEYIAGGGAAPLMLLVKV